ncbi:hypothetical protein BDQ12DRAFT_390062 [Crucibulum laeve]|uniref:DUF6534 domain-containing protein n=1 Tax=Crucibulum laeve TaxID=68775 RepID=A0A5C3M9P5_9AGAR|nr:hypothetical protein BDQ12DRAFT_390062 [Crucibulum laeve]
MVAPGTGLDPAVIDALRQLITPLATSFLFGYLISWALQGILCVQVYTYYLAFPNDRWQIKVLVYSVFLIEVVQTLFSAHDAWAVLAKGYGDPLAILRINFLWLTIPIVGGIVGCIGQCFFAYRIYVLSGRRIITACIVTLALCATAGSLVLGVQIFNISSLASVLERPILVACGIWNGCGAVCDVIIACFMTYSLYRSNTGFRGTHILINKLIRLTIETGIVTGK